MISRKAVSILGALCFCLPFCALPASAQKDAPPSPQYGVYDNNPSLVYYGNHGSASAVEYVQADGQPAFRLFIEHWHGSHFTDCEGLLFISRTGVAFQATKPQYEHENFQAAKNQIKEANVKKGGAEIEIRTEAKNYTFLVNSFLKEPYFLGPPGGPFDKFLNTLLTDFDAALREFQQIAPATPPVADASAPAAPTASPAPAIAATGALPPAAICAAFAMQRSLAAADQSAAPARPPANGPSLADTMKFIQERLSDIGTVNFVSYISDSSGSNPTTYRMALTWSAVSADASTCRISYHASATGNGTPAGDGDMAAGMWQIEKIGVVPADQFFALAAAKAGHPEWSAQVQPVVTVLRAQLPGGSFMAFAFYDADLANRVAIAMTHSAELCGAGNNKEPF
jgi:hypothetical protein